MRVPVRPVLLVLLPLTLAACGDDKDDKKKKEVTPGALAPTVDPICLTKPKVALTGDPGDALLDETARHLVEDTLRRDLPAWLDLAVTSGDRTVGAQHFDVALSHDGLPLCGPTLRASLVGGEVQARRLPALARSAPASTERVDADAAAALVTERLTGLGSVRVLRSHHCLAMLPGGQLTPALSLDALAGDLPYRAVADGARVHLLEMQALHATGQATVFKRNSSEAAPVASPLTDLVTIDRLASSRFRIIDANGAQGGPTAPDGNFAPAKGSPAFAEVSVFAHAEEMMAWYDAQVAFDIGGCAPLEIEPHALTKMPNGELTANNAFYLPSWGSENGHPLIKVGDGDGSVLKELGVDFDPVAHELGHHIVVHKLKSFSGESLILHEGLADYFVYAYTGDTCLGETICPKGSPVCFVPDQCLRTADITFKFNDETYSGLPYHLKGQAVSGLLVGLGKDARIGKDVALKLTFSSLDFLPADGGIADLVASLLAADKAANASKYSCAIVELATARGLTVDAKDLSCAATP